MTPAASYSGVGLNLCVPPRELQFLKIPFFFSSAENVSVIEMLAKAAETFGNAQKQS